MLKRLSISVLAALVLAACHKAPPKEIELGAAFSNIPLPPQGTPLVRQGSPEAISIIAVSPLAPDSVAGYYRTLLSADPWHLVNESKSGKSTTFYAEQSGPSLWVLVAPNGSDGSQVTIAGAADSTSKSKAPKTTP